MLERSKDKTRPRASDVEPAELIERSELLGRYRRRRIDAVIDYFGATSGERRTILSTDGPFAETKE